MKGKVPAGIVWFCAWFIFCLLKVTMTVILTLLVFVVNLSKYSSTQVYNDHIKKMMRVRKHLYYLYKLLHLCVIILHWQALRAQQGTV